MSVVDEIRREAGNMKALELLRYLLTEKFPGKTVVTSSLRARSIVVLSMVAEIAPSTPVIFCHAPHLYPESVAYAAKIIDLLGLTDVRKPEPNELVAPRGVQDRFEQMWVDAPTGGKTRWVVHLNKSLQGFDCWISAVYHGRYEAMEPMPRIADEAHLIRVCPLAGWTELDVRAYMAAHNLPYHPRVEMQGPPAFMRKPVVLPTYDY